MLPRIDSPTADELSARSDSSAILNYEKLLLTPVFPLNADMEIDFDTLDCVPSGEVNIIEDEELGNGLVVELSGKDSRISFYTQTHYNQVVGYVNNCKRYTTFNFVVQDSDNIEFFIEVSNHRSTVSVEIEIRTIRLPLEIAEGWQRVCIDFDDILFNTIGTRFKSCTEVVVAGGPRIYKLFFQGESYFDPQLPPFLRVLIV